MPTGPVTVVKAWIEMIHRYLAMGVGVLIIALMVDGLAAVARAARSDAFAPALPTALFLLVCLQGAFGAWTVTHEAAAGRSSRCTCCSAWRLLALLAWLGGREDYCQPRSRPRAGCAARPARAGRAGAGRAVRADRAGRLGQHQLRGARLHRLSRCARASWCRRWTSSMASRCGANWARPAAGALPAVCRADRDPLGAPHLRAGRASPCWAGCLARMAHAGAARDRALAWRRAGACSSLTGLATVFLSWPLAIAVLHNARRGAAGAAGDHVKLQGKYQLEPSCQPTTRIREPP